jgi:hypothetical protein
VHVRTEAPKSRFDLMIVGIELFDLRVNLLSSPRCHQDGDADEEQQTAEGDRRYRPRSEPHQHLPVSGSSLKRNVFVSTAGIR